MNTKLKRTASLVMSILVAISSLGSIPVSAEESKISSESGTDAPTKYTVTLPYYEECSYAYDSSRFKENSGGIKLSYEAKEKVAVSLQSTGQAHIDQVKVIDDGNHEVASSWNGSTTEFTMPKQNVKLNVSFAAPQTDPSQNNAPQTDQRQAGLLQSGPSQTDSLQSDAVHAEETKSEEMETIVEWSGLEERNLADETGSETEPKAEADMETEAAPKIEAETQPGTELKTAPETEVKTSLEAETEAVPEAETETVSEPGTETDIETEINPDSKIEADSEIKEDSETKTGSETKSDSEIKEDAEIKIDPETVLETESASEMNTEPETVTQIQEDEKTASEDFIAYSMEGEGKVSIFTYEDGKEVILCTLTKSGEVKRVSLNGVNDLIYVRMTPNTGWYPYEILENGETAVKNLFLNSEENGVYTDCLMFPVNDFSFRFLSEKELALIPMPFGDGTMDSGGYYYNNVFKKGATSGADISAPKKGDIFTVSATYHQHCSKENKGYVTFKDHPGYATISSSSKIAKYLGTKFQFNTCGTGGSTPCPTKDQTGKLYIWIKGVKTSANGQTSVEYQYFWWNNTKSNQNVYYKGSKTYKLYGIKIVKTLKDEKYAGRMGDVYDLAATFTIKDSKGKLVDTVTTDSSTGIAIITDLDAGTYTITETKTSKNATAYAGDPKKITYDKKSIVEVEFENFPVFIKLTVEKRNREGEWEDSMLGAVYSLRDDKDDEDTEIEKVTITSKSVKVKTPLMINKTYYLVELEPPASGKWALNTTPVKITTAVSSDIVKEMEGTDQYVAKKVTATEDEPSLIGVRLLKSSQLSSDNEHVAEWLETELYDIKGAVYTFYSDQACTEELGEARIKSADDTGVCYSNWVEVPVKKITDKKVTVYYKETVRPLGHIQDPKVYSVTINLPEDKTKEVKVTENVTDKFIYGYLEGLLTKVDASGQPLEGAEFTISVHKSQGAPAMYTWVFRTGADGTLDLFHPVSGKIFLGASGNHVIFPEGFYIIRETKAPEGYINDGFVEEFELRPEKDENGIYSIRRMNIPERYTVMNANTASVRVRKKSAMAGYEVEGCVFEVSLNRDFSEIVGTLTSGKDGYSDYLEINSEKYHDYMTPSGRFSVYVRETGVPEWFTRSERAVEGYCIPGQDTTVEFINQPKGRVSVQKTSANPGITAGNGMYSFEGAKFHVSTSQDMKNVVATLTAKADGSTEPVLLDAGTYYVQEASAPKGYRRNTAVYDVVVAAGGTVQVTIQDEPVTARAETLLKKQSDGSTTRPLSGAEFTVKYYDNESCGGEPKRTWVLRSDKNGEVKLKNEALVSGDHLYGENLLPLGSLLIIETKAPSGYMLSSEKKTVIISDDGTGAGTLTYSGFTNDAVFKEAPLFGGVKIAKICIDMGREPSGDASLGGAVYQILNHDTVSLIRKGEPDTGYAPGAEIARITTNSEGIAGIGAVLQSGKYIIREVSPSTGYLTDTSYSQEFEITEEGQIVDLTGTPAVEPIIRGGFELSKWDLELNEEGVVQGDAALAGGEFTLVNSSAKKVKVDVNGDGIFDENEIFAPGDTIRVFTTDQNGKLHTPEKYLPYGTYTLTETKPPKGYTLDTVNGTRLIRIREDGQYDRFTSESNAAKDRIIRGDIELIKFRDTLTSEEPGDDVIPVEGCEFEVRLKSTGVLFCTLVTDEYGFATTADPAYPYGRLPYGTYTVTETKCPDDLNKVQPFEVIIDMDRKVYRGIYKNDHPIEMPVTLVKVDAESGLIIPVSGTEFQILDADKKVISFTNHYPHEEKVENFVTDGSGTVTLPEKLPYGTYYLREVNAPFGYLRGHDLKFQVTESGKWAKPLTITYPDKPAKGKIKVTKYDTDTKEVVSGAVFSIFAAEDIVTGDGITHFADGVYAGTVTVDDDGIGYSEELYLGKYYLQESKAPEGYCLDTERHYFELEYADQDTELVICEMDCLNKPTTMKLHKSDKDGYTLDGIRFELRRIGNIAGSGVVNDHAVSKGAFVTAEGGLITAKYLVSGIYSLTETETLPGYILDESPRYFTVDTNGFIYESDVSGNSLNQDSARADTITLEWKNDYTKWEFSKVDVSGDTELAGAEMEIQNQEGKVLYSWISDGKPHRIEKIPAGSYTLVEKTAPEGYVIANSVNFEVTASAAVQRAVMTDKQVFISKKGITGEEELPGATLAVIDKNGEIVDSWTSTEKPHPVYGLIVGETYTLREESAPAGYALTEEISFVVLDDRKDQYVVMRDEMLQIRISKQDITTGKELPGAKLVVTDQSGVVMEEWISGEEPHMMNLPVGTYTLTETAPPEKYATAESITFEVKDTAEIQRVEMVDTPIQVAISKQDITTSQELPGAKLTVTDKDGAVVEEWISGEEPHMMNLPVGTYTLTETVAPEKYATAESIEFEVTDSAEIQKVEMKDSPIQVSISKKDITNDKELPGAKLVIKDSNEQTVEEWISTGEEHLVNLPAGKYTLTEMTAPEGYEVAETINFEVTDTMEVQHITMYDSPKKEEKEPPRKITPEKPSESTNTTASPVKTGDVFRYLPAIILIGLGAMLVIAGGVRKAKDKKKENIS